MGISAIRGLGASGIVRVGTPNCQIAILPHCWQTEDSQCAEKLVLPRLLKKVHMQGGERRAE
jgi:hypothetical protein